MDWAPWIAMIVPLLLIALIGMALSKGKDD